ncbi:MAG: HAD family phosphatase [Pseudobdellovibrionaceae bacterium]
MTSINFHGRSIKAVAFDMDGTMIDCEPSNRAAVQRAAGSPYIIDWNQCAGKPESVIHTWLRDTYPNFTGLKNAFVDACKAGYKEELPHLKARAGIKELMASFHQLGIPMIVVTNTETPLALKKLKQCGLLDYVTDVIGVDKVIEANLEPKPSGDGYRLAAQTLGVDEENMAGFEDSAVGVSALTSTRLLSVHIYDHGMLPDTRADIVINGTTRRGLDEMTADIYLQNPDLMEELPPEPRCTAYA